MKNDLDFIKDKFESSGINAPSCLDESFVLDAIKDVEPMKSSEKKTFGFRKAASIAAAAAVVLAVLGVSAFFLFNSGNDAVAPVTNKTATEKATKPTAAEPSTVKPVKPREKSKEIKVEEIKLSNYSNIDDIKRKIEQIGKVYGYGSENYENLRYIVSKSSGGSASSGGSDYEPVYHSETYRQEENIDEPDTVKTDGNLICFIEYPYNKNPRINIYNSDNGSTTFESRLSPFNDVTDLKGSDLACDVHDMFLEDKKLTVMCSVYNTEKEIDCYTYALTYDVSDPAEVQLESAYFQGGRYIDSRLLNGRLYIISAFNPFGLSSTYKGDNADELKAKIPSNGYGTEGKELSADKISIPDVISDCNIAVIGELDAENGMSELDCRAVLGYSDTVYCSESNLYLISSKYPDYDTRYYEECTFISKLDITDGIQFKANIKTNGSVENQYMLDEYNGNLRVAMEKSTEDIDYDDLDEYSLLCNHAIYIFDENLKLTGSTEDFAEGESIKAAQYIDDKAYIITFNETDPIFVADLSDPKKPKILGEAMTGGYSTVLVPSGEGKILGIGYGGDQNLTLKLTLFDVSDPINPKVLDTLDKDCYSEVMYNTRSLVYNPQREDYIIPLRYEESTKRTPIGGMMNIKVENGKIRLTDEYKINGSLVNRCVYIGDYIYLLTNSDDEDQIDSVKYKS